MAINLAERSIQYAGANRSRFLRELQTFIRFPSVGGQPEHDKDMKRCTAWLAAHLREIGLEHVRVIPHRGHPILYADWIRADNGPTVLIYGHYDVQPPDPLDRWESAPFEPVIRGHDLFGRGASDDKGQLFVHVKALESYLRAVGEVPINVKCLFEGEEELGSPNLPTLLAHHKETLAADIAVMSDMRMLGPRRPPSPMACEAPSALN